jgi:hypothetical protein
MKLLYLASSFDAIEIFHQIFDLSLLKKEKISHFRIFAIAEVPKS